MTTTKENNSLTTENKSRSRGSKRRSISRPTLIKAVAIAALLVALIVSPVLLLFASSQAPYLLHIAILTLTYAIVATSMNMPIRTGYWPVGQAAFMAAGGYTSAVLTTKLDVSLPVGIAAGAVIGGLLAFVFGRVTLRLAGTYFVLATFAFGEIVRLFIVNEPNVLGGASGITGLPTMDLFAGAWNFTATATELLSYYYVALSLLIITVIVVLMIYRSSVGSTFDIMRTNLRLAQAQGLDSVRYRVFAFTGAGVFAGLGGALLAHYLHLASPLIFTYVVSVDLLMMNIIGGTRMVAGPLLGAAIIAPLPELLRGVGTATAQIAYGAVIILVILALPGGLLSLRSVIRKSRATRAKAEVTRA
jgi:branched-chain amino acid transport system permease protein